MWPRSNYFECSYKSFLKLVYGADYIDTCPSADVSLGVVNVATLENINSIKSVTS